MKITEYKGEDAIDLLADIMEPAGEIIGDPKVEELFTTSGINVGLLTRGLIKHILKNHKKALLQIMARLENVPYDEYVKTVNIFTLPKKALEMLDDKELMDFFVSQGLKKGGVSFGSVMENTEVTEIE